jgi:hypothetical protein
MNSANRRKSPALRSPAAVSRAEPPAAISTADTESSKWRDCVPIAFVPIGRKKDMNDVLMPPEVDRDALRVAIREEYEAVAREPQKGFHFHTTLDYEIDDDVLTRT